MGIIKLDEKEEDCNNSILLMDISYDAVEEDKIYYGAQFAYDIKTNKVFIEMNKSFEEIEKFCKTKNLLRTHYTFMNRLFCKYKNVIDYVTIYTQATTDEVFENEEKLERYLLFGDTDKLLENGPKIDTIYMKMNKYDHEKYKTSVLRVLVKLKTTLPRFLRKKIFNLILK